MGVMEDSVKEEQTLIKHKKTQEGDVEESKNMVVKNSVGKNP